MDYKKIAAEIVTGVGGEENIEYVTHCVTRLRFELKNNSQANDEMIENISGVKGVMKQGGQYQIIIGGDVNDVYQGLPTTLRSNNEIKMNNLQKQPKTIKHVLSGIFDYISSSLSAALPAIIGCGMVKLVLIILELVNLKGTPTYEVLSIIGDAGFYFLPIIIGYTSAKKINTDVVLAIVVSAVLVHPTLITALSGEGLSFLSLPIFSTNYAYSVVPPLFASWVLKYVLIGVGKITPNWAKSIFQPLLALLITVPIVLIIFAPMGAIIGVGLTKITEISQQFSPWFTKMILSALMPLLIFTGMHHAFDPMTLANFASPAGFDDFFFPMMLATNFALGAACIAVGLKTKDKNFKSIAFSSAVSASVAGITEPGLFGVLIRLKRPLIGAMIGSGIAGIFVGLLHVKSYAFASPGIVSMIAFISPNESSNIFNAIFIAVIATIASFVATYLLGFKDVGEGKEKIKTPKENDTKINSPLTGKLIPMEEVQDATFSNKLLGDGIAIVPENGQVYAPFDATVQVMFKTGHAVGLLSEYGDEILIHVGIDTVKLEGEGFVPHVKEGEHVRQGELLLEVDLDYLSQLGYDCTTPVIFTNSQEKNKEVYALAEFQTAVKANDEIIELRGA
jgi:PTS system beta-glucosides-specific IIC component